MAPTKTLNDLSESQDSKSEKLMTRITLEKFERSKILEIYFARLDGRVPDEIPAHHHELYSLELEVIKGFLLGQHPQDPLLAKIFMMMS